MDAGLLSKLQKILALTTSPIEAEAQAAATHLQRLLTKYNLDIADLEKKGAAHSPGVRKQAHDLGKAAFTWKLDLAEAIAEHYYCHPLVNRTTKTVAFIGRPDNVESLQMLYGWIIDQIRRIATEERRRHFDDTGEHIDPLRWQVNFGIGAVERLEERLKEQRARQQEDVASDEESTALVVLGDERKREISDYLESQGLPRIDGRETKMQRERRERREAEEARLEQLKETDIEAYYAECPWERPETEEEKEAREKREAEFWKREAARERKNARRRANYIPTGGYRERQVDEAKIDQGYTARSSGRRSADRVNLQPFIKGRAERKKIG